MDTATGKISGGAEIRRLSQEWIDALRARKKPVRAVLRGRPSLWDDDPGGRGAATEDRPYRLLSLPELVHPQNERNDAMKMTTFFLSEFDREVERSRRALEQAPDGKYQWKPHDKSMIFGYLSDMIATMPMWLAMQIRRDELDIAPKDGSTMRQPPNETSAALVEALDKSAADARSALEDTTDEHLMTPWRLQAGGQVVMEAPRYAVIQDTFNHWAHHRGQMTVYLRLMGAKVPALYGPSADDNRFE